jgi:hypothetical protein
VLFIFILPFYKTNHYWKSHEKVHPKELNDRFSPRDLYKKGGRKKVRNNVKENMQTVF